MHSGVTRKTTEKIGEINYFFATNMIFLFNQEIMNLFVRILSDICSIYCTYQDGEREFVSRILRHLHVDN